MKCRRCACRWSQGNGLCRRCQRETNVETRTTFERERDHFQRQQANRTRRITLEQPTRTVVIDEVQFEVVWDGTVAFTDSRT